MKKKNYLDQAFHELEPKYNAINLTFAIVLFVSGISFLFREGFLFTAVLDISIALFGVVIHIFRHRLKLQNKMILTLSILLFFAPNHFSEVGLLEMA